MNNYDFHLGELPSNIKYSTAYTLGFMFKYNIKNDLGFFFQFNTVKLNISDKFSLIIDSLTFTSEDAYRLGNIYGTEKRTNFDIGVCKTFSIGEFTNIFAEFGFNLNNTKVLTSKIKIENLEYSLINVYLNQSYVPNTSLMEYNIQQGGIGYGMFFSVGVQLIFNETITLDPGISVYFNSINLEGYQAFKLHYNIFIRFSSNNIL